MIIMMIMIMMIMTIAILLVNCVPNAVLVECLIMCHESLCCLFNIHVVFTIVPLSTGIVFSSSDRLSLCSVKRINFTQLSFSFFLTLSSRVS